MTPRPAALEAARKIIENYLFIGRKVEGPTDVSEVANIIEQALSATSEPQQEPAIPIKELRALWAPLESLPPLESAGKLMRGLAAIVTKYSADSA